MSEQLLFASGSADVAAEGKVALASLAKALNENADINVNVEGHTDSIPIAKKFTDNWALSVARSTAITRILVKEYQVVHQIGSKTNNFSQKQAEQIKSSLGKLASRYVYADYFFAKDQATYIRSADLVICRAGAHTVYELVALNKKAIIVPIPWVSHQEQLQNAKYAQSTVGSLILGEADLSPQSLNAKINEAESIPDKKLPISISNDAVEKVYLQLEKMALI